MHGIRVILISLILWTSHSLAGSDWTLVKYSGRDHVTAENIARFYGLGEVTRASMNFTLGQGSGTLRGAIGSNELYINNLKFILSYPISEHDGQPIISRMDLTKVIEPVLRPSRIRGAEKVDTIVLDPGHGGHDNGATSLWGNEKTFTLDVARRTEALLVRKGFKVRLTRTDDTFIPLEDRAGIANQYSNALFVSIHFNSGDGSSAATGIETYTLAPRGVPSMAADGPRLSDLQACAGNVRDSENMALATAMHASLVCHSQLFDRGIKRARFVVIRDVKIPGVLIEGGFLSNPSDSRKIASTQYRQNMAFYIAAAILQYRNAVGTQAPPSLLAGKSLNLRELEEERAAASENDHPVVQLRGQDPVVVTAPAEN